MPRSITPGIQSFTKLRQNTYFYVDKTKFITDWWNRGKEVLICGGATGMLRQA